MHSVILGAMVRSPKTQPKVAPEDAKLREFYDVFRVVKFKKDEIIFLANSEPTNAYAVKSGFIRSFSYTDTNDERSISFVLKNEMLPIAWIYTKSSTALFNYIAHTDCELYEIDRDKYHEFVAHQPELSHSLLMHSVNDIVTKKLQIQALEQATAEHKILHTFNYFCIRYGKPMLKNLVVLKIPLTQKDIASFTGLTRETVTNVIISLKRQKILTVSKRFYTIDIDKLRSEMEMESENPTLN